MDKSFNSDIIQFVCPDDLCVGESYVVKSPTRFKVVCAFTSGGTLQLGAYTFGVLTACPLPGPCV